MTTGHRALHNRKWRTHGLRIARNSRTICREKELIRSADSRLQYGSWEPARQIPQFMKRIAQKLALASGLIQAVLRRRNESFILKFHGIGGPDMPAPAFDNLLERLGQYFQFSPLDVLLDGVRDAGGRLQDVPSLYLTFDDGLRNNFTVAYPILKKRSIPATFYVCPGLIESGSWIWTHEMRERLRQLSAERLAGLSRTIFRAELSCNDVIFRMKSLGLAERASVETEIRSATSTFQPTNSQREAFELMGWRELRKLNSNLITIGSHTMTHPMLDSVTTREGEYEVAQSRMALEKALDREIRHFCYPDGRYGPGENAEIVRRTYRTAVVTKMGGLSSAAGDLHQLPRLPGCPQFEKMAWILFKFSHARGH